MADKVRTVVVGTGSMARNHIRSLLHQQATTRIDAICEPSPAQYEAAVAIFSQMGLEPPANQPDLGRLLSEYSGKLDAAFIISPHAFHHDQAVACMQAGLDVLLEKPMVISTAQAQSLIDVRDRTGRLLVVAFPGSLTPGIRQLAAGLRAGEYGRLLSISATTWEGWGEKNVGTWRENPEISGGGFLFDTGAHMLNTAADLAGEDFAQVAAWVDNYGRPVETMSLVMARLRSGALVSFHSCGETIPCCESEMRVFCTKAILRMDMWGGGIEIQRAGEEQFQPLPAARRMGVWEQFLAVRSGEIPNPCPPEIGLRMARLIDAIRASAARGGQPVNC